MGLKNLDSNRKQKMLVENKLYYRLVWVYYNLEVIMMSKQKGNDKQKINVELGGMDLFGTTSNAEVGGYKASGDIENAGRLDKGFQKVDESDRQAKASLKEGEQEGY